MVTSVRWRRVEIRVSEEEHALDDAAAARFLDALDHPERFTERLRWLADLPSVLAE